MLPCDLREKGDDDDLEISLVVIVVAEESRINQVALVKRERERKEKDGTGCKRAWCIQTAPSGLSLFILFRLGYALCINIYM